MLLAHGLGVAAEELVAVGANRGLQQVDGVVVERMGLAGAAQAVHAADFQRYDVAAPGGFVEFQHFMRDAGQADAGNARGHAGEEFAYKRAREADGLEIIAAAIGGDDGDAELAHDFEQALVHRFFVAADAFLQGELAEQAASVAVGDALLRQVGVDGGGADADQYGEVMHIQAFGRTDIEAGEGAQALADQMGVHRTGGEDHGDCRAFRGDGFIGEDDVGAAGAHALLRLAADALDGAAQTALTVDDLEGAIHHAGIVAHGFAHRLELGGGEHRGVELQQVALLGVFIQHVAEVAQAGFQRHHAGFAQAVDGRVGDLGEALAEEMVQAAVFFREHGERRVVAHGAGGFLCVFDHGVQQQFELLQREANGELAAAQGERVQAHGLGGVGFHDMIDDGDTLHPVAEILAGGEHVLHFGIVVKFRGIEVHADGLAGADMAFFDDFILIQLHHAGFRADDEHAVPGDGVTQGAQPVTVQPGDNEIAVGGGDGGRSVPGFHDCVAIAEQIAVGFGHRRVVGDGGRDHQRLGHRRVAAGAHQQLEHVVQRGGV